MHVFALSTALRRMTEEGVFSHFEFANLETTRGDDVTPGIPKLLRVPIFWRQNHLFEHYDIFCGESIDESVLPLRTFRELDLCS